ncbi:MULTISPECIES: 3-deoxy-D-manno-octulosonic acid kinase [unclassified Photobacterium]|uniref:3-deoxy-D-manno-octulosonic acid kinase n=1 Tax=unclassified Photobacterium TaxID=2628852 RepID=UPI000D15A2E4|nr:MULTISPECIES: 3-deoxy-D-manno-octulosonic acid kinase [unclassified Photobacterium]PSV25809.1 3-deoxy-D-manno-octulosonic acid kinase [Photobacterium sp. GB-56]PSV36620.1 3-deoxy-D-manno-octulosonic acid kinase [Photobacterium sp. GB-27]PSV52824.1 3-deoxy-D-manno-octulosonic acid kinase [Photobacterium sp. GB-1]PSV56224.1 3-deoxy-D-manno-octulosonic acid kinase [Photobacterium sp. GB-3]
MQKISHEQQMIWFDDNYLTVDPHCCFEIDFWRQQNAIVGSAQGRGTTWFVAGDKMEMALRHYRRGGLFGKLVSDSYWFTGWDKTRSYAELMLLKVLREGGVNVPRPVAAKAEKKGCVYRADILVEKIPHSRDLVALLIKSSLPSSVWRQIGIMIRKMHDLQVCHTDLNAHNILLDMKQQVWLIDFDKCYQQQGESWKKDNLARLERSFIKEVKKRNIQWQAQDWQALCDGYQQG